MKRRVVITGMGVLHSLGQDIDTFWESIKNGKNGISTVTKIDCSNFPTKVASEMDQFDPTKYMDKKDAKRMDLFCQYAMAATHMAVQESKLDFDQEDPFRVGVLIGSGIGGLKTLEEQKVILMEKGPSRVSPFFIPMMIANMASGQVAIRYGIRGFNECVSTACATANHSIGDAFHVIRTGLADVMITGGAEAPITELSFAGFCASRAMSTNEDPERACRPFDKNRDGFVMGEGAAIIVLEELEHARKRGASIIAEVVGYGCTCDAYHITAPHPDGIGGIKAMQFAIDDAGIKPEQVDYVNAHGTSTPLNDPSETSVIKKVFDDYAYKLAVSSTKSMTGHLLGAAGAVEALATIMAIRNGVIPPTINHFTEDPEIDSRLDFTFNVAKSREINVAISNTFGFGGHNATLVFKKF